MKLIRKGQPLEESPGLILPDGREVDTSSFGEDYDEVFFETDGLERLKAWADENASELPSFPKGALWFAHCPAEQDRLHRIELR